MASRLRACTGGLLGVLALAFLPARAAIPTAAIQDPRYALGYLVVTHYPDVDETGVLDSTADLQQAIDDARAARLAVFFPNQSNGSPGVYIISDTLKCYSYELWGGGLAKDTIPIVGSSLGGVRPVIKLASNASAFSSASEVRPMLAYRVFVATNSSGTQAVDPGNPFDDPPNFKSSNPSIYDWALSNIDFDCNENPGAVGVSFPGAQATFMGNIRVDATGAYAGFIGMPGVTGSGNIEVIGGKYGIINGSYNVYAPGSNSQTGGTGGNGLSIAGLKLYGQTEACLLSGDVAGNPAIAGFHFKPDALGTAIQIGSEAATAIGPLCLLDGIVELPSGSSAVALENTPGKSVYYRNVYVTNTGNLIQSGSQSTITGSGTWKRIREYAYTDQSSPPMGDPPYELNDTVFETYSVIDGAKARTPVQPVVDTQNNASAPPEDLISRHVWKSLPSFEDGTLTDTTHGIGTFVNITDPPYSASAATSIDAINNPTAAAGGNDDRAAIQAAIDAAWDNGNGHGRVLVPRGGYQIGGTLTLRPNTTFIGVGLRVSSIGVHSGWEPTTGSPPMIQTADDADATTFFGFLLLEIRTTGGGINSIGAHDYDRFSHLLWRAGRNSETIGWLPDYQYGDNQLPCNRRIVHTFTGNGGGRHYAFTGMARQAGSAGFRNILISGTSEPLWFYGCNVEASKVASPNSETNIQITDAANVRLLGFKREGGSPTLVVDDSENIGLFGHEDRDEIDQGGTLQVLGDSSNVLIAIANARRAADAPSGDYVLREAITGQAVVTVPYPDAISLYKRGTLDDTAVYIAGSGGGTTTVARQVDASNNDKEDGKSVTSPDLELGSLFTGVRFTNVTVPQFATITSAKVTFREESGVSSTASVIVYGQDADDPGHFGGTNPAPGTRARTSASVAWNNITSIENVDTPDLSAIVQEIVDRGGWASGNAMVILFENNGGKADAAAYDHDPAKAPVLEIQYASGNTPPTVALTSPGASSAFVLGETVPLAATASDTDGVALVEFYRGGTTFIADDQNAPYTYNWSPAAAGNYSLTAVAHDLGSPFASATSAAVPISVIANSVPNITTSSLPGGAVGVAYNQSLSATGGNGALSWSLASGALPAGLSLSSGGVISGTPTAGGTANVTVRVADADGLTGGADEDTQALSIAVSGGSTQLIRQVSASNDDREGGGSVTSTDLELGSLFVGVRFTNVTVPQGATITSAKIRFREESGVSSTATVAIYGEDENNAVHFGAGNPSPSLRTKTTASIAWNNITSIENVDTPDIKTAVQEIVNRGGWTSGNAMVILFENNGGKADAAAYDLDPAKAPVLEINYQ